MKKLGWIIPPLIVAINAALVLIHWSSLPETLPAHFDCKGRGTSCPDQLARSLKQLL
ncbi:MAG: TSCPD domain-containing protein [Bacteroidales bacterium]|nr:TSCPD domain-containing protein [Bacteroidales bacterium]